VPAYCRPVSGLPGPHAGSYTCPAEENWLPTFRRPPALAHAATNQGCRWCSPRLRPRRSPDLFSIHHVATAVGFVCKLGLAAARRALAVGVVDVLFINIAYSMHCAAASVYYLHAPRKTNCKSSKLDFLTQKNAESPSHTPTT